MKKFKCPFETQELEKVKYLFAIQEFNIFNIQNKNVCLQYTNYEKMKIFLSIHELWKYFFKIHELWKNETVCSQCMNWKYFLQ